MKRKSPRTIVKLLLKVLKEEPEGLSISDISRRVGAHWKTAREYLDLINYIQNQPKIIRKETKAAVIYKTLT